MDIYEKWKEVTMSHQKEWYWHLRCWCNNKNKDFHREIGVPFRMYVNNIYDIYRHLLFFTLEKKTDFYISLLEFKETVHTGQRTRPDYITHLGFNKLMWDLDAHENTIQDAYNDAVILYHHYECKTRTYFTGNGCHVYLDLTEPIMDRKDVRDYQLSVCDNLNLMTADKSIFGDTSRILRLPYTLHPRALVQCVPIDLEKDTLKETLCKDKEIRVPKHIIKKPYKLII